jgi:hypothetical protein
MKALLRRPAYRWVDYIEMYKREPVNRSQMDIKHKTCDIRTWKQRHLFLDISPPTLIHLSHLFTSAWNPQHRSLLNVVSATPAPPFQPLRHQRNVCHVSRPTYEPFFATDTSHHTQETFLYEYPLHNSFCPQKQTHNWTLLFSRTLQARSPFWLLKPASALARPRLLPRLS